MLEGLGLLIPTGGLLLLLLADFDKVLELLAGLALLGTGSLSVAFLVTLTGMLPDLGVAEVEARSFKAISFALNACLSSVISYEKIQARRWMSFKNDNRYSDMEKCAK